MIIDAHNHPDWYGHNLKNFLENMQDNSIDITWLLSWEAPDDEYDPNLNYYLPKIHENGPISLSSCLSYAEKYPDKFILGYAPDPRRPDSIDKLKAAIDCYGVRIYGELKLRMMLDNPDAIRMFRFCGKEGLPVIVHIDYEFDTGCKYPRQNWWYGGGIEAFERAITACPETIFIGHASGFWAHISSDDKYIKEPYPKGAVVPEGKLVKMLRKYPNLFCDISAGSGYNALNRDHKYAKEFLTEFKDRILYARDGFGNELQELLSNLDLPNDVLKNIYSLNALKLVPLNK